MSQIMPRVRRFSQLSPARQALVRLCQRLNFGLIQSLGVQDADPVFDPGNVVLVDEKLDVGDSPRLEAELLDFELAAELSRLMTRLDEIRNGRIERIEVRGGIPCRLRIPYLRIIFTGKERPFALDYE
jgi:hypothetical protein